MKKIVLVLLTSLLLTGCTSSIKPNEEEPLQSQLSYKENFKEGTVRPTIPEIYKEEFVRLNDPDAYKKALEAFDGRGYASEGLVLANTEMPDFQFEDIDGGKITKETLKGKKVLIEFVAEYCGYCKQMTKDVNEKFSQKHSDMITLQVFGVGDRAQAKKFYEEIGKEFKQTDNTKIILQSEEVDKLINTLTIDSFPATIFMDEEGKIGWKTTGLQELPVMENLYNLAFNEKIKLKDEVLNVLNRNYLDVKNSLTDEAVNKLATLKPEGQEQDIFEIFMYKEMNITLQPELIKTVDGGNIAKNVLTNNNVIYASFVTDRSNLDNIKTSLDSLKDYSNESGTKVIVLLFPGQDGIMATDYYKNNKDMFYDFPVVDGYSQDLAPEFTYTSLYAAPLFTFVDKSGQINGEIQSYLNGEKLKSAADILLAETPIYTFVK